MSKWPLTPLAELASFINGRAFKPEEWCNEGLQIIRIQDLTGTGPKSNRFSGVLDAKHVVQNGDLLLAWSASLGVYRWQGPEAALNQHIFRVVENTDRVSRDFLYWVLVFALEDLKAQVHGGTMQHITKPKLESTEVPVPPLAIQQQLVRRLDEQIGKKRCLQKHLQGLMASTDEFEEKALDDEWISLCDDYPVKVIGDLLSKANYGTSVKCKSETSEGAVPVLRIPNVAGERLDLTDLKHARLPDIERVKTGVAEGDVLLVRTNGSRELVGRTAVARGLVTEMSFASYLIRLRFNSDLNPEFAQLMLRRLRNANALVDLANTSAGQYNVSLSRLRTAKMPVPPLGVQSAVVKYLAQVEQCASRAKVLATEQLQALMTLERSLLKEAFA